VLVEYALYTGCTMSTERPSSAGRRRLGLGPDPRPMRRRLSAATPVLPRRIATVAEVLAVGPELAEAR